MQTVEETEIASYIQPGSSATASIAIKVGKNSDVARIKHVCDIEKAMNMENIDSYLGINF